MNLDLKTKQELCDWLMQRSLDLGEAAHVIAYFEGGDSFEIALLKVFQHRKNMMEEKDQKCVDLDNTITS